MKEFFEFPIKDWLIAVTTLILIFCILEIRKLKKSIAQEIQKRLLPQLLLEFVFKVNAKEGGFYLKNESFFVAKDIIIEDAALILEDFGFKKKLILRFENSIEFLRPQERVKLEFKVFDTDYVFLPDVTERIIPHLGGASFKVSVRYSNIENLRFCVVFFKKKEGFSTERIDSC